MSFTPEIGSVWVGWSKRWRVDSVKDGTALIVNIERPENTMRVPFSQFANFTAAREP